MSERIYREGDKPSREEVWLRAWLSVAGASNSTRANIADDWADHCLKSYDQRFNSKGAV